MMQLVPLNLYVLKRERISQLILPIQLALVLLMKNLCWLVKHFQIFVIFFGHGLRVHMTQVATTEVN